MIKTYIRTSKKAYITNVNDDEGKKEKEAKKVQKSKRKRGRPRKIKKEEK